MYLDATYIAKFYVNESDSKAVRAEIGRADVLMSSAWSVAEVTCVLHRHRREGSLTDLQFQELLKAFFDHVDAQVWRLIPVSEPLLRRMSAMVSAAPAGLNLRAGDAFHLATAQHCGEREVWTNDRRMLAAAPHFGLIGRTASIDWPQ
jgi:predicted nucleic acid-binding protein